MMKVPGQCGGYGPKTRCKCRGNGAAKHHISVHTSQCITKAPTVRPGVERGGDVRLQEQTPKETH